MDDLLERWTLLNELALDDEEDFAMHVPLPMLDESAEEDGSGAASPPAGSGDGSAAPADPNETNSGAPTGDG